MKQKFTFESVADNVSFVRTEIYRQFLCPCRDW